METGTDLPYVIRMAWALGGIAIALGAVGWTIFFLYPYLRRMEKKQELALKMGIETAALLEDLKKQVEPIIGDVREVVHRVKQTSDDMSNLLSGDRMKKLRTEAERYVLEKVDNLVQFMAPNGKK